MLRYMKVWLINIQFVLFARRDSKMFLWYTKVKLTKTEVVTNFGNQVKSI